MERGDIILRSRRKSISAEVDSDGRLVLRVPQWADAALIDRFLREHAEWIDRHRACPPQPDVRDGLAPAEIAALRAQAQALMPALCERFAPLVGAWPERVRITSARRRFGSCSGRANLCFSLYLCLWPQAAAEYVCVHELCHLLHRDHSPRFWREVERVMPDYRARAALLSAPPGHLPADGGCGKITEKQNGR